MNKLFLMLADSSATGDSLKTEVQGLWSTTVQPIFETVIWVLVGVLAMILIVKGVMTALAVMKAADEPQVRQEKIQGFKYLAIGLVVGIIILSFANVIMKLVTDRADDVGPVMPKTSFLF